MLQFVKKFLEGGGKGGRQRYSNTAALIVALFLLAFSAAVYLLGKNPLKTFLPT